MEATISASLYSQCIFIHSSRALGVNLGRPGVRNKLFSAPKVNIAAKLFVL